MSDITNIVFFGDSLTDQGNMHDLTSRTSIFTIPVESAGYGEAFTNGPVHAQTLTGLLGASSENYAVGGAKALGSLTLRQYLDVRLGGQIPGLDIYQPGASEADLDFDISFGGQVQRYLADAAATPPGPGSAAAFFIGLNDYSEFVPTSIEAAPAEAAALVGGVVNATISAAAGAVAAGMETVVLYSMPNFRFFPLSTLQPPERLLLGDQIIAGHNGGLAQGAAVLEGLGAEVEMIDLNRMSAEIMADPETFGLRADLFHAPALLGTGGNPTLVERPGGGYAAVFAPNPAVAGVDPDQIAFIDFAHPGATIHGIWGVFSAASLCGETAFLGDGDDVHAGGKGADLILAGGGRDRIAAGGGADTVLAGLGADRIAAGRGDDIAAGGAGCDVIRGGRGDDVLAGGAGRDVLRGGSGSDVLIAGPGRDLLAGGAGADAFILIEGRPGEEAAGRMIGGAGEDKLYLMVDAATRAAVEAEWLPGAARQSLEAIGFELQGIEHLAFLDPDADPTEIPTPARLGEAALWGLL